MVPEANDGEPPEGPTGTREGEVEEAVEAADDMDAVLSSRCHTGRFDLRSVVEAVLPLEKNFCFGDEPGRVTNFSVATLTFKISGSTHVESFVLTLK